MPALHHGLDLLQQVLVVPEAMERGKRISENSMIILAKQKLNDVDVLLRLFLLFLQSPNIVNADSKYSRFSPLWYDNARAGEKITKLVKLLGNLVRPFLLFHVSFDALIF